MNTPIVKARFVEIYNSESDAIFRFCLFKVSDRDAALDLAQETFTRFWDALSAEKEIRNHRTFLFTIARNLIIDWYRKKKSISLESIEEADEDGFARSVAVVDSNAETDAEVNHVIGKINELEEPYRQAVYLRFVEELKPRDIAVITGDPVNVISVRIHRGLERLRGLLHHSSELS